MVFLKRIILLSFTLFLTSCSSTKIEKIEKFKVLPGVSTGNTYFSYKIIIHISEDTSFKKITVGDNNNLEKFSVVNLDSNMQGDNSVVYSKGKYSLQFNLPYSDSKENREDIVKIGYNQNGKLLFKSAKVSDTKIINLK